MSTAHNRKRRSGRDRRPLYARALRLKHVRPGSVLCFVFFEGAIALGVLLTLAELVPWWMTFVLVAAVAVMVKLNDVIAGAIVVPDRLGSTERVEPADDDLEESGSGGALASGSDEDLAASDPAASDLATPPVADAPEEERPAMVDRADHHLDTDTDTDTDTDVADSPEDGDALDATEGPESTEEDYVGPTEVGRTDVAPTEPERTEPERTEPERTEAERTEAEGTGDDHAVADSTEDPAQDHGPVVASDPGVVGAPPSSEEPLLGEPSSGGSTTDGASPDGPSPDEPSSRESPDEEPLATPAADELADADGDVEADGDVGADHGGCPRAPQTS